VNFGRDEENAYLGKFVRGAKGGRRDTDEATSESIKENEEALFGEGESSVASGYRLGGCGRSKLLCETRVCGVILQKIEVNKAFGTQEREGHVGEGYPNFDERVQKGEIRTLERTYNVHGKKEARGENWVLELAGLQSPSGERERSRSGRNEKPYQSGKRERKGYSGEAEKGTSKEGIHPGNEQKIAEKEFWVGGGSNI